MFLFWLFGCGEEAMEPTPWSYDPTPTEQAQALTPEEVGAAISEWVPALYDLDLTPLYDSWDTLLAAGDEACPTMLGYGEGSSIWQGGCATGAGASFDGYAQHEVAPPLLQDDGWTVTQRYLYAIGTVSSPEGWSWSVNGYFASGDGTLDTPLEDGSVLQERYGARDLQAEVSWDGPGSEGTWLSSGLRYGGAASWYEQVGVGRFISLEGSVSGMDGPVSAVAVSGLSMLSTQFTLCPVLEPSGIVSVRAANGRWYDVIFDAPTEFTEQTDLATCDGCGRLWSEGQDIGEVCVDLSDLVERPVQPW